MAETRYWKRVGMRMTRELAFEMESKMNAKGSYLDEDLEEFTAIDAESSDYKDELEALFSSPDEYAEMTESSNLALRLSQIFLIIITKRTENLV